MLRDLTIKNYRAFKDFSIDGLARVNLIVGQNNAGKTSFLEAVYLLANGGSPAALIELLDHRNDFILEIAANSLQAAVHYQVGSIFTLEEFPSNNGAQLESHQDTHTKVLFQEKLSHDPQFTGGAVEFIVTRETAIRDPLGLNHSPYPLPLNSRHEYISDRRFTRVGNEGLANKQFIGVGSIDLDYLADLADKIIREPQKEALVTQALQIIDPHVQDWRFTSRRTAAGTLVKLENQAARVTLSSLGEGMSRVMALAMAAVVSENGILLVDEIDTGLYHGTQMQMWELLFDIAQRLNVQIFATTHSWDCVEAFQEALADSGEPEEGLLFRLQRRGDKIYAVDYSIEQLGIAVSHAIEVR